MELAAISFCCLLEAVCHRIGLSVFQDQLGIERSFVAKASYAYHIKSLGPGELGVGIDIGMVSKSFTNNYVAVNDYTLDPTIPNANTSAISYDASLGLYYEIQNKMYVGLSALHIPQTAFTEREKYELDQYLMRGGNIFWVMDPQLVDMDMFNKRSTVTELRRLDGAGVAPDAGDGQRHRIGNGAFPGHSSCADKQLDCRS